MGRELWTETGVCWKRIVCIHGWFGLERVLTNQVILIEDEDQHGQSKRLQALFCRDLDCKRRNATNFRASHLLQLLLDLHQECAAAGSEFLPESIEESQMMPPDLVWHSTTLPK